MATKKLLGKKPWMSKTLWFNVTTIAIGVVQVVNDVYVIDPEMLALTIAIGNFLLRVITKEAVTLKNGK